VQKDYARFGPNTQSAANCRGRSRLSPTARLVLSG
jgi:hypothetical protein